MEVYHESETTTVTRQPLRRFEYVVIPPIRLVLDAILAHCAVGGSIAPGIRQLGEWSGVTLGLITDCLRQLDTSGIITYDGRTIMVLCDPDVDPESDRSPDRSDVQESEQSDRSADRSLCDDTADRTATPRTENAALIDHLIDQPPPPHTPPMVIHDLAAAESAAAHESLPRGGMQGGAVSDRSPDRSHLAAAALAELGADAAIIADALRARPDLTAQQVADTWAWHQLRRERDPEKVGLGIFFHAIRHGHLRDAPPDLRRPIAVERYVKADPAFYRRGDDVRDLPAADSARPELLDLEPPRSPAGPLPPVVRAAPYVPPKWRGRR